MKILNLYILEKPFEIGDELTRSLKMKRAIITKKYENKIREMYRNS